VTIALPVRRVKARPEVEDCAGRVALMRGPLVYAIETSAENPSADSIFLPPDAPITPLYRGDLLGGVYVLQGDFQARFATSPDVRPAKIAAIPYYAYGNRGPSALRVWIPEGSAQAMPNTLAGQAQPSASFCDTRIDQFNRVSFPPVTTSAMRSDAQLQPGLLGGILEWKVE
jgi:hypothetical protein